VIHEERIYEESPKKTDDANANEVDEDAEVRASTAKWAYNGQCPSPLYSDNIQHEYSKANRSSSTNTAAHNLNGLREAWRQSSTAYSINSNDKNNRSDSMDNTASSHIGNNTYKDKQSKMKSKFNERKVNGSMSEYADDFEIEGESDSDVDWEWDEGGTAYFSQRFHEEQPAESHGYDDATHYHRMEPDVWVEMYDESRGYNYYYNERTHESRWEAPEWVEEIDESTGARLYQSSYSYFQSDSSFECSYYLNLDKYSAQVLNSTWSRPSQFDRLRRMH
jgi:hypothetical protein